MTITVNCRTMTVPHSTAPVGALVDRTPPAGGDPSFWDDPAFAAGESSPARTLPALSPANFGGQTRGRRGFSRKSSPNAVPSSVRTACRGPSIRWRIFG